MDTFMAGGGRDEECWCQALCGIKFWLRHNNMMKSAQTTSIKLNEHSQCAYIVQYVLSTHNQYSDQEAENYQ